MLLEVHGNLQALLAIEVAKTSCVMWASVLESLIDNPQMIYARDQPGKVIQPEDFAKLERHLREGKAVLVHAKLPGSTDHAFTIEGDGRQARILHAWQDGHALRVEDPMPIEKIVGFLKELPTYDYSNPGDVAKVQDVRRQLWGLDHEGPSDIAPASGRESVSIQFQVAFQSDRLLKTRSPWKG